LLSEIVGRKLSCSRIHSSSSFDVASVAARVAVKVKGFEQARIALPDRAGWSIPVGKVLVNRREVSISSRGRFDRGGDVRVTVPVVDP
jgi:hypothetical protein